MRTRQHFGRIRIQRPIINIKTKVNNACERGVLRLGAHLRVREEEDACDEGANYHGIFPTEKAQIAEVRSEHGTPYAGEVDEGVVAPGGVSGGLAELGAARRQVLREENIVKRIREADEDPGEPDEGRRGADAARGKQTPQVDSDFADAPFAALAQRGLAAGGHLFEGEGAGTVVLFRDEEEGGDGFCVAALADEEFGGFAEAEDGDAEDAHDEDEGAGCEPDVSPTLVIGVCAGRGIRVGLRILAREIGDEGPRKEARDELSDACNLSASFHLQRPSHQTSLSLSRQCETHPTNTP